MTTPKPTKAQHTALTHLAKGGAYRSLRAYATTAVIANGTTISAATASILLSNGWAQWGPEEALRRPLLITDAGRAYVAETP